MDPKTAVVFISGCVFPSMIVAWIAGFVVRRNAARWGLVDQPGHRKVHESPTPLGGGLAIWLGVMVAFALGHVVLVFAGQGDSSVLPAFARPHLTGLIAKSQALWILLAMATVMMLLGLLDDRVGLGWKIRLGVQVTVAAVGVVWQGWRLTAFVDLWFLTALISVVWIVGLVNSFNMLDNMDGLSAGVAAISAAMLAGVLLLAPDPETSRPQLFVSGLLLVLVGALVGFLWHNRPPARLFMGDAGSYFVGFFIAVATLLATFAGYHSETQHTILAPLCVMAVPLYDTTSVVWIRLREGRSPFEGDTNHFSHRLVELGLSKRQSVLTIYLLTATCGLAALLLYQVDVLGACLIVLLVACVLALIAILETTARRRIKD